MELFSMMAMNAAIPQIASNPSIGLPLLGLVGVLFAIAGAVLLSVRRERSVTAGRRRSANRLTVIRRPAFGAAH